MPIGSHLPQANLFSLVPTFNHIELLFLDVKERSREFNVKAKKQILRTRDHPTRLGPENGVVGKPKVSSYLAIDFKIFILSH
jgi:hypothetical protein